MANPHWPLFDLRISRRGLELRYPTDDVLFALAGILAEGIHDPATMPFSRTVDTRRVTGARAQRAALLVVPPRPRCSRTTGHFHFAVFEDGDLVGVQDVFAKHFATTRTVTTGSWLVQRAQGRGIGKEMRAAVLHLAFAGLGAVEAYTDAFEDNPASLGVTRALGYEPNGAHLHDREGSIGAGSSTFVLTRDEVGSATPRRHQDRRSRGVPAAPRLGPDAYR